MTSTDLSCLTLSHHQVYESLSTKLKSSWQKDRLTGFSTGDGEEGWSKELYGSQSWERWKKSSWVKIITLIKNTLYIYPEKLLLITFFFLGREGGVDTHDFLSYIYSFLTTVTARPYSAESLSTIWFPSLPMSNTLQLYLLIANSFFQTPPPTCQLNFEV